MALSRKRLLLAKIETTSGTDAVPTGAANSILTKNLQIQPLQGNTVKRNVDRAILGGDEEINTGVHTMLSFDVELAGAGAAGDAPGYGVLLRACGFAETLTASTDAQYDPVSTGFETATLYFNLDGELHSMVYCQGNVSFNIGVGDLPTMSFKFTGLYVAPSETAMPTADHSSFQVPLPVTKANTPTFTVHGYAATAESISCDMGNNVKYRNVVNSESVLITDREVTGSLTIEKPTLTQKNFYTSINANTLDAIQVIHGTAAGNIVQFDAPTVQLKSQPSLGDSDGIATLQLGLNYIPSDAGDDEIKLTVK